MRVSNNIILFLLLLTNDKKHIKPYYHIPYKTTHYEVFKNICFCDSSSFFVVVR